MADPTLLTRARALLAGTEAESSHTVCFWGRMNTCARCRFDQAAPALVRQLVARVEALEQALRPLLAHGHRQDCEVYRIPGDPCGHTTLDITTGRIETGAHQWTCMCGYDDARALLSPEEGA